MALTNKQLLLIFIIVITGSVLFYYFGGYTEKFASLGTIVDIQSKDTQDKYLNGNEINPYVNNNYLFGFNMSTRGTNRGSNMLKNSKKDIPVSLNEDAYCFGSDFYDNGKCGEIFLLDDFGRDRTNELTVFKDQYSSDYVNFPNVDVMRPLNTYQDSVFKK